RGRRSSWAAPTAGEIGPTGYTTGGISGASIAAEELSLICRRMDGVHQAKLSAGIGRDALDRGGPEMNSKYAQLVVFPLTGARAGA
ncbi:MAG: hypothetical protein HC783_17915, partial [Rhodobacteraceae bacterium]|nr:hypothetical protein [Paracoccaceae bacterium]